MSESYEKTQYLFEKLLEYVEEPLRRGETIYHFIAKNLFALGSRALKRKGGRND
jgi:hypothetical protein